MENKFKTVTPALGKLTKLKAQPKKMRKPAAPKKKVEGDEPSLANWKPPFPVKK